MKLFLGVIESTRTINRLIESTRTIQVDAMYEVQQF